MGVISRILGFDKSPIIGSGSRNLSDCGCTDNNAKSLPLIPFEQVKTYGDTLANRSGGTHKVLPTRALSAQTRLKNVQYELPAYGFTNNPETAPWRVQTPAIPGQTQYMATVNNFTVQPMFLSPIANMQIQSNMNWINKLRTTILGMQNNSLDAAQQTMFPSIFSNSSGD